MITAIAIDDEPLALQVIEHFCSDLEGIKLERIFTKPTEAIKYIHKFPIDLIFLDIKMPAISGINLAKEVTSQTMVIFTTAYSDYAVESYDLNALDYLLKPIKKERFMQAIEKAKDQYRFLHQQETKEESSIFVRSEYKLVKILLEEILYIEGVADYIKFYVKERKPIMSRMTMKEIVELLPDKDFKRIHRSFIIPIKRILSISNRKVKLPEREIPIGNTYLNVLILSAIV
jgi:DNA-binding LytR/AlgR family response regulator